LASPADLQDAAESLPPRVSAKGLSVFHSALEAVRAMDVDIAAGTTVGLVGSNGSGKTTLLSALAGRIPFRGDLRLDGQPVRFGSPRDALARGICMCPANRGIFFRMTVHENLLLGGYTLPPREAAGRVEELLDRFPALRSRLNVVAGQLSGGERQQVALARAFVSRPGVVLLDEPSRGLSPAATALLLDTVREMARDGITIIIADQAIDWLHQKIDRLLVVANGRLVGDSAVSTDTFEELCAKYFDLP
jgi:branched-chain amino acid transport system ATP-binding protein